MPTLCSDNPGACFIICDFCAHYDFNGDPSGAYTGDGWCRFHKKDQDPCGGCSDFFCFEIKPKP